MDYDICALPGSCLRVMSHTEMHQRICTVRHVVCHPMFLGYPGCHSREYICENLTLRKVYSNLQWGSPRRSWLRQYTTSRKVAGSIPDRVIGVFHLHNPPGRTMALGSTQFLTDMSTTYISWGKGGRCVELTTLLPSCADCLEIWEPQPPGTLRACPGL